MIIKTLLCFETNSIGHWYTEEALSHDGPGDLQLLGAAARLPRALHERRQVKEHRRHQKTAAVTLIGFYVNPKARVGGGAEGGAEGGAGGGEGFEGEEEVAEEEECVDEYSEVGK